MSRLIEADAVINVLKETGIIQDNDLGHLVVDEINRIPTAYDLEKVVAELETELRVTRNAQSIECIKNDGYGTPLQAKNSGKIEMLLRTIDMVRKGGAK